TSSHDPSPSPGLSPPSYAPPSLHDALPISLRSPVAKLSCEAATEENATCQELSQLRESFGATEFASKEWSDSHGNANQAQSKSESVKNGADDDEVFSNKGVEIDLNSGWRNC